MFPGSTQGSSAKLKTKGLEKEVKTNEDNFGVLEANEQHVEELEEMINYKKQISAIHPNDGLKYRDKPETPKEEMKKPNPVPKIEKFADFAKPHATPSEATKPTPRFFGNLHVEKPIPTDYKMQMKAESPGTGSASVKSPDLQLRVRPVTEEEQFEYMPSNENIKHALETNEQEVAHKNVSVIDDSDPFPGTEDEEYKSKVMETFKSSVISASSSSYDFDKMSDKIDDIVKLKEQRGRESQRSLKGRDKVQKMKTENDNRILPAPSEMESFFAMRKPPEEEFFLMTLMCYKLNHLHMEKICDINGKELYNKAALDMRLPFFQFPNFIEKELDSAYLNVAYQKRKKKHLKKTPKKLTKLQKRQRRRVMEYPEQLRGKILDDDYEFDDSYFN